MHKTHMTLYEVIANHIYLTDLQLWNLKELLGKGIRSDQRKQALARLTSVTLTLKKNHADYKRIWIYPNGHVEYTAGQDYPSEMRTLRDLFFK